MPSDYGKGSVAVTERGQLFITLGRFNGADSGWYGIGFNGERVVATQPEFLARNLNAYLLQLANEEHGHA